MHPRFSLHNKRNRRCPVSSGRKSNGARRAAKNKRRSDRQRRQQRSKIAAYADVMTCVAGLTGDPSLISEARALRVVGAAITAGRLQDRDLRADEEWSAWLRGAVQEARERAEADIAAKAAAGEPVSPTATLYAYLGGYAFDEVVGEDEDKTCDRCRRYCSDGLVNGTVSVPVSTGQTLLLDLGLCDDCCRFEQPEPGGTASVSDLESLLRDDGEVSDDDEFWFNL